MDRNVNSPRVLADQLRRFIQNPDSTPSGSGISLSDAGFVLLSLKDQILADSIKAQHFSHEFVSKPINGIELLGKVVIVLQGIVNSVEGSGSKISYLLNRNSTNANRKRKAAVAEADCIESIKLLLEKSILVARLFNKLIASAPTPVHRALVKSEVSLAQYNPDFVEKLIGYPNSTYGGMDTLIDELNAWKSLNQYVGGSGSVEHNHIYGTSEVDGSSISERSRRHTPNSKMMPVTSVVKNVERQRFRKQGAGSGGRAAGSNYYFDGGAGPRLTYDRRSQTLSHGSYAEPSSPLPPSRIGYATERREPFGAMRRAKSESAMVFRENREEYENDSPEMAPRGLKRFGNNSQKEQVHYHPIQQVKTLSRSVHDLAIRDDDPGTLLRPVSARPPSSASRTPYRAVSPTPVSPIIKQDSEIPSRRLSSALSPRARFADPPTVEAQMPHAGFSYLFPQQPVSSTLNRPVSAPLYATAGNIEGTSRPLSPLEIQNSMSGTQQDFDIPVAYSNENGQVVYVPINIEGGMGAGPRRLSKNSKFEYTPNDSRSNSRAKLRSPSINGEDVRNALSQFDYLYDYEADQNSPHKTREATYHL
uniref:VHS domain-containing protein n=1 Tax=Caenorhabditis tropicalis TaxID=1561998 RepID=A0A1I7TCW1_9PELO